jgi:hypothetical protein
MAKFLIANIIGMRDFVTSTADTAALSSPVTDRLPDLFNAARVRAV